MRKLKIVLGLFIIASVLTLTGCFEKKSNDTNTTNEESQTSQTTNQQLVNSQNTNSSASASLGDNASRKCTWDKSEGTDRIIGIVYIAGDKFYQEVTFPDNGKFFAINNNDYYYTWNTRVPGGFKANIETTGSGAAIIDTMEENEYTCEPWTIDNSLFIPPSDIEFVDDTEDFNQASNEAVNTDPCDVCDASEIPSVRDVCRQQNNCD